MIRHEDDEDQERRAILKDGERIRVSLMMRDGATINPDLLPHQRGKALHIQQTQTADAVARRYGLSDAMQLHRPGFRRNPDAGALARVQQAYQEVEIADANAWKGGHLRRGNGKVESGPDQPQDPGIDAKAAAYAEYDREMADAWRK